MRSNHRPDITQGSLRRGIWSLTWPITISQALLMLPNVYDAIWLGQLGSDAQAAAGLTLSPMIINLVSLWLLQIPLAYLLPRLAGLDADGIWLAVTVGWILQAVLMGLRFRQGRWKLKRVV